jgi:hypothetical protein
MELQGYRTFIIAGLQITAGVLAQTDWVAVVHNPKAGAVAIGSGLLMATMRAITSTPPGRA